MALFTPTQSSEKSINFATSLIALAATVALLYYGRDFFVTLIVAAVFAFILDPVVELIMRMRVPRAAATGIVIGVAVIAVYVLMVVAWTQLSTLSEDLPTYTSRINELLSKANDRLGQLEKQTVDMVVPKTLLQQQQQIEQKPQEAAKARRRRAGMPVEKPAVPSKPVVQEVRIQTDPKPLLSTAYSYVSGYFHVMVMAGFVPFLVYFMLSWRDHISRTFLHLFQGDTRYVAGKSWLGISEATRAYVLGNFFLWIFLSSVSAIVFFLLAVPYWPLIGPLSAFFSLVPYVGLPLSVAPPVLAALAIPNKFKVIAGIALITAALHVFAMNFLYAKIIGRKVRLNPFVVTVALMFWGTLWGGVGLILAVPVTAGLKAVCDNVESLHDYGKILGDD
ncbi:MAG TPA: AI-2E family transporter [Bryobacteraceae bacterium]|nr:AI-2E family transporter [Bryobacteraceae bacterium]